MNIKENIQVGSYIVLNRDLSRTGGARYWHVRCLHCGIEKTIRADSLKKNCICKCQKDQMINQLFGDFKVIERTDLRAKDKCIIYKCECVKCGHIQNVASNVLRSNRKHCDNCHINKTTLIDMTGQTYNWLTVLERDNSIEHTGHENDAYWICRCNLCGSIKSIRGLSIRNGLTKSCGCINSVGETIIAQILTENNINFKKEYSFNDLKYIDKLRFDFAIFDKNNNLLHLVEYDGDQHFKTHNSGWNNQIALEKTQLRDNLKNEYCKEKGIKLIRIRYDEQITFEKIMGIEEMLNNDIK